jgi:zinc protease
MNIKHYSSIVLASAIFAALLTPATLTAQQNKPWEKIPAVKLHDFKPQQPRQIVLKNGIVIFLQEDHELPFVYGRVSIPGGERDEDLAKAGLVSLYSGTWRTSGTAKLSGDAMDDLLESKAASIETFYSDDAVSLSWRSLKEDSDEVLTLALDLLFHPKFSVEKLKLAQQQEATNVVRRNDNAGGIAYRESEKLVYGANSPYTHQPELATIGAITIDDLNAWHDLSIHNKLFLVIGGDFDPAAMEAKLRLAFESLPPVKALPVRHDVFAGPKPGITFIDKKDVNQSTIEIVGLGTDRHNPDVPTLAVMNEILGSGFSSRLFQKVRTELGLAYGVGGGYGYTYDHPGEFSVYVGTKSATTVQAIQATLGEIAGLTTKPFTQVELDQARNSILNSFLFQYDTKRKVLNEQARFAYYGYPADYLETYEAGIKKVTLADLDRVARKYIHPDKLAVLVVGNGAEIKPGLEELKLGPIQSVDITIPKPPQPASDQNKQ